jgi:hypothetical protein
VLDRFAEAADSDDRHTLVAEIVDDPWRALDALIHHEHSSLFGTEELIQSSEELLIGSRVWSGVGTKYLAPELIARPRESSVEITQTGTCLVDKSFLSRSSTRHPSMSGRKMSSVIACG